MSLLPIESLPVPIKTGEVMGLGTAELPAFPPTWRLGTEPYPGFPLPIGSKALFQPVLSQAARPVAVNEYPTLTTAGYTAGVQAWFAATGEPLGALWLNSGQLSAFQGGEYWYFASKIKRNAVANAYFRHQSYSVQRVFSHANPRNVWSPNLFDQSVQDAWNDAGGFFSFGASAMFPLLTQTPCGMEDTGISQTFTWHPIFATEGPSVLGSAVFATLGPSQQQWLRLEQLEDPVNGNSVNVTQQIQALFPGTDQISALQRTYARRFAEPQNWETQKRDFTTATERQGEIPALNCVPLPSFRVNVDGLVTNYRQAFETHGDFVCMAWKPCEDDESSVWVLNRMRWPRPVMLPDLRPQDVGLPDWFQGDVVWPTSASTAPTVALTADKLIGSGTFNIGSPTTEKFNVWDPWSVFLSYQSVYAKESNVAEVHRERQLNFRSVGGLQINSIPVGQLVPQTAVDAAIASDQFLALGVSALGDFACIGFSAEEAMRNTPPVIWFYGGLAKEFTEPDEVMTCDWQYQCAKIKETGIYVPVKALVGDTFRSLDDEVLTELQANTICDWANAFYNDPNKYLRVGTYYWRDGDGNFIHEQPIYGHTDLVSDFTVTVQFNKWENA